MKILITTLIICIGIGSFQEAKAQLAINRSSYSNAIGLRAGPTSGLTFKHMMGSSAFEGIVGIWPAGFSFTGLYEMNASTGVPGLNWYYGGGAHIAVQPNNYYYVRDGYYYYRYRDRGVGLGIDGVIGIEYKIKPIPFALSFDLKPMLEVNTNGGVFTGLDPGLGLKVTF